MRMPGGACLVLGLLVPGIAAQTPASVPPDAAALVAVEREFAADGATRGWAASFRRYHAPGAILLQPDPITAEVALAKVDGDGPNTLLWRPAYAGIARSGDFGFTTGPAQIRGQDVVFSMGEARDTLDGKERLRYLARVWQLRPDGWRLVFDELILRRAPAGS